MKKLTSVLILSGLTSAAAVAADAPASKHSVAGNMGVTSDYLFRGISQTQKKAAIQGGFDYTHADGPYAGVWMSNQGWVNAGGYKTNSSIEIDLYGGYRGEMGGVGYDIGVIQYEYPGTAAGTTPDTTEAYLGLSMGPVSVKYSQAVSDYFIGWGDASAKSKGSNYLELNASHDLGNGLSVSGHVGHQKVKNQTTADYTDYKLAVSKDIGYGVVSLAYWASDADKAAYTFGGVVDANDKLIVSFAKSF